MGEEERGPYTTDSTAPLIPDDAAQEIIDRAHVAERRHLHQRMRALEDENEHLRRLLVAALPPDAVYQEARELARRLRGYRP